MPNTNLYGRERVLYTLEEIESRPPTKWLIDKVLPEQGSTLFSGKYGAGKSFGALGMGLCIAADIPWHGRAVQQGAVVYVAAEGVAGMGKRARAWKKEHGITGPLPFRLVDLPVNLMNHDDVTDFIDLLKTGQQPLAAVFLDTLNRCMPGGDENSTRDGGIVVASIERIRRDLACHVLIVHHMGWAATHSRGSTTIPAAMETEIHVNPDGPLIKVHCEKQKDSDPFSDFWVSLKQVRLSDDPDDSSCVWSPIAESERHTAQPQKPQKQPTRSKTALHEEAALSFLRDRGLKGATFSEWHRVMGTMPKTTFCRLRDALFEAGKVEEKKDDKGKVVYILPEFSDPAAYEDADEAA